MSQFQEKEGCDPLTALFNFYCIMKELCLLSPLPPVHIYPAHLSVTNQHLMKTLGQETQMHVVHFNVREGLKEKRKIMERAEINVTENCCLSETLNIHSCKRKHMRKHTHTICPLQFCQSQITWHLFIFHSAFITLLICCPYHSCQLLSICCSLLHLL